MVPINYWAVLVSAAIMVALGALWYGPLFGEQWMAMAGMHKPETMGEREKRMMMRGYAVTALGALLMSYILAHALIFMEAYLKVWGAAAGIEAAIANWLGFVVPATVGSVLWEGKPWKYWCINAGYYFAALLIAGVVLAMWT